jgi:hypothetical protein
LGGVTFKKRHPTGSHRKAEEQQLQSHPDS